MMSKYYITSESAEDTLDFADNLDEAIRLAKEVARKGTADELVCIEYNGRNIWDFVLRPNGSVDERKIA